MKEPKTKYLIYSPINQSIKKGDLNTWQVSSILVAGSVPLFFTANRNSRRSPPYKLKFSICCQLVAAADLELDAALSVSQFGCWRLLSPGGVGGLSVL